MSITSSPASSIRKIRAGSNRTEHKRRVKDPTSPRHTMLIPWGAVLSILIQISLTPMTSLPSFGMSVEMMRRRIEPTDQRMRKKAIRCWASELGGCSAKQSREHVISQSLFAATGVQVKHFGWCRNEEQSGRHRLSSCENSVHCAQSCLVQDRHHSMRCLLRISRARTTEQQKIRGTRMIAAFIPHKNGASLAESSSVGF